jgi:hypothetical protein
MTLLWVEDEGAGRTSWLDCRRYGSSQRIKDDSLSGGSGAASGLAGYDGEDGWKTLLAVGELAGELTADEGGGETAKGAKGQSKVDGVGDKCAFKAVAGFGQEAVAMTKAREWAVDLFV